MSVRMTLPVDSSARKEIPVYSGVIKYAPAALASMAKISKQGNDKHNPGQPLHHARGKSNDHADCVVRHVLDVADIEAAIVRAQAIPVNQLHVEALLNEASQMVWRALIWSQELHEKYGGAPLAPGAVLPVEDEKCQEQVLGSGIGGLAGEAPGGALNQAEYGGQQPNQRYRT